MIIKFQQWNAQRKVSRNAGYQRATLVLTVENHLVSAAWPPPIRTNADQNRNHHCQIDVKPYDYLMWCSHSFYTSFKRKFSFSCWSFRDKVFHLPQKATETYSSNKDSVPLRKYCCCNSSVTSIIAKHEKSICSNFSDKTHWDHINLLQMTFTLSKLTQEVSHYRKRDVIGDHDIST